MKIIIPMAGTGARFVEKGYKDPKPLIRIRPHLERIVEYVLRMFDKDRDDFVFICNDVHVNDHHIHEVLREICPYSTVVSMPSHKKGPIFTVQAAYDHIADDEEVIISYCDGMVTWDKSKFLSFVHSNNLDGCLITHTGFHPHTLSSTKMAFVREEGGKVLEVKEKAHFTDNPQNEHASSGVYYFRRGRDLKFYFDETVRRNINYNGEHYVTLSFNPMIEAGLNVGFYDTDYVAILGTPNEVENFEAWATIIKTNNIHNDVDLSRMFKYWQGYWKTINNDPLEEAFSKARQDPDMGHFIGYHFDKILEVTKECKAFHVVELGTRKLCSAYIWLKARVHKVTGYDIYDGTQEWPVEYSSYTSLAKSYGTDFEFIVGDSTQVDIPQCDILFVDTVHTHTQVSRELSLHARKVNHHIIVHDTHCEDKNPNEQSGTGVMMAIQEFLALNGSWKMTYDTDKSQGLTILSREKADCNKI
jgi:NDP-sugar pyrophosphorylase family protein